MARYNKFKSDKIAERLVEKTGTISERDGETIIFGMVDGITVCFQLKDLSVGQWKEWKDRRIGRLLPPYLTRLQQRYSAYLQRPGLTKIPKVLLPAPVVKCPVAAAAAVLAAAPTLAPIPEKPVEGNQEVAAAPVAPVVEALPAPEAPAPVAVQEVVSAAETGASAEPAPPPPPSPDTAPKT